MARNVKDLLAEANSSFPRQSLSEAAEKMHAGEVLVGDVRDPTEVQHTGKLKGAINVSRGMLEFRADPESQYHNPVFQKDRTVLPHCASGGRSALAGKPLQDMGYPQCSTSEGSRTWRKQALTRSLHEIELLVQPVLSLIDVEHLFNRHLQWALADVNAAEGKAAAGAEIEPVETGSPMAVLSA